MSPKRRKLLAFMLILALMMPGGAKSAAGQILDAGPIFLPNIVYDSRRLPFDSNRAEIALGRGHVCVVTATKRVKCWGGNGYGQLGDGTTVDRNTPGNVVGLNTDVVAVAAGDFHTCALTTGGGVQCWGPNISGQLGNETIEYIRHEPVVVEGMERGVATIVAGGAHTCALTTGGDVKCWGDNASRQLGNDAHEESAEPVNVEGLDSDVTAIDAGTYHTCALTGAGGVKCWGGNFAGQLGDGTEEERTGPVDVVGLEGYVTTLNVGGSHTCVLVDLDERNVMCWGANLYGQIGDGTNEGRSVPVDVVGLGSDSTTLAAGGENTCVLTAEDDIKCWGNNIYGQLGDGTGGSKAAPVDVVGLGSGVGAIAVGFNHTCALTEAGGVKCWGSNQHGQIGDGTDRGRPAPVDVVGLDSGVAAIATGEYHTCAVTDSGAVKCWGSNFGGQLGDGTTLSRLMPVDVVDLESSVIAISAGSSHTCALTSDGEVKCWGDNFAGQLGDGTTQQRLVPENVVGLGNVLATHLGRIHTCALTIEGRVACWGDNGAGKLGNGTGVSSTIPVDVVGLNTGVAEISTGEYHTCAVTDAGVVACWGHNVDGRLGDGTEEDKPVPASVVGLESGVATVAVGPVHTCVAMISDGVRCWGRNFFGQLGDGTSGFDADKSIPVDVVGLENGVVAVAVGGNHTCALTSLRESKCWGSNYYGQLGNDSAWRTSPVNVVGLTSEKP